MSLTPRQGEVMKLLAKGLHRRDIASLLGLSCKTVDAHRQSIRHVLGLSGQPSTTMALVRKAKRKGVVS